MIESDILLQNFIDLSEKESLTILSWRNDDNVRKWMYNSDIINADSHLNFVLSLKKLIDKKYFLVYQQDSPIGVIYFTDINHQSKVTEFGLYSNPAVRGVGDLLMHIIKEYAFNKMKFNKLIAEVYADNRKAINLYLKHGFTEIERLVNQDKEIIHMELKHAIG